MSVLDIYHNSLIADRLIASEQTHQWMETLSRGSYDPMFAWVGGGIALGANIVGNIIWYSRFEGKL